MTLCWLNGGGGFGGGWLSPSWHRDACFCLYFGTFDTSNKHPTSSIQAYKNSSVEILRYILTVDPSPANMAWPDLAMPIES